MLARHLKEARLRLDVTQEKLSVLAGIDEFSASARMNQYEKGKHSPHYQIVTKLASVLNVTATYFYSDDDLEAEMLLEFARLKPQQKTETLEFIRQFVKNGVD
ncbi:MAG: transcriptional regulator [Comamonadaceae bacterium CG_4_9_14_0_8_um_filter_57_21]|nr:MAG: transcriptional regulator [Comamonadaceae bacterium CG_4_9_14_0_8_um_filter_57_21]